MARYRDEMRMALRHACRWQNCIDETPRRAETRAALLSIDRGKQSLKIGEEIKCVTSDMVRRDGRREFHARKYLYRDVAVYCGRRRRRRNGAAEATNYCRDAEQPEEYHLLLAYRRRPVFG